MSLTKEERERYVELLGRRAYPGLFRDEEHELAYLEAMSRRKPVKKVEVTSGGVDGRITEEGRRKFYGRKDK